MFCQRSRRFFLSSVFFVSLILPTGTVLGLSFVPLEGKGVMAGNSGAFNYSIPIQVPLGRNGLTPQIALNYNSRMGNGFLGMGWSLSIGHVMRNTKHGLDYNCDPNTSATPCFVYMLGGSSSELIRRPDWCGNCYGSLVEGSFTKFEYANDSWTARDKNGKRYIFGNTNASRQLNGLNVFKWDLVSETDTHANNIAYNYFKSQGEIYIDYITYQDNAIFFTRDDGSRPDKPTMYTTNIGVTTAYRLKDILVRNKNQYIRKYALAYCGAGANCPSGSLGQSLLGEVKQLGSDLTSVLSRIEMKYEAEGVGTSNGSGTGFTPAVWPVDTPIHMRNGGSNSDYRVIQGDFIGDGKADLATISPNGGGDWSQWVAMALSNTTGTGFISNVRNSRVVYTFVNP